MPWRCLPAPREPFDLRLALDKLSFTFKKSDGHETPPSDRYIADENGFRRYGSKDLLPFEGVVSECTQTGGSAAGAPFAYQLRATRPLNAKRLLPISCEQLGLSTPITSWIQSDEDQLRPGTPVKFFLGIYELGLQAFGVQPNG